MAVRVNDIARSRYVRIAAGLVTFTLVVLILYAGRTVLIPVALALTLAFLLNPAVMRLQQAGASRVPAVLASVFTAALLIGGLIWFVGVQLNSLANDLPGYQTNIRQKIAWLRNNTRGGAIENIRNTLDGITGKHTADAAPAAKPQPGEPITAKIVPDSSDSDLSSSLQVVRATVELLGTGSLALILAIFMLIRREDLRNRLVSFTGEASLTTTTRALNDAGERISRYMVRQFFINASFGFMIGLGLFLIGIPYALLWGICAGILRYVPYLGTLIGLVIPMVVSFITSAGWRDMLMVFGLFLFLELIVSNVMEPYIYGQGTGVSEVALLFSAAFWAWLWGPVGLVLATPLTVCVVVSGKYVPALGFFDRLLGDQPALKPYAAYLQRLLARDDGEAAEIAREFALHNAPNTVYDSVFLPALALARQDRTQGIMTAEDEDFVLQQTLAIMRSLSPAREVAAGYEPVPEAMLSKFGAAGAGPVAGRIFGWPAHHEVEELTLGMLDQLVEGSGLHVETFSTRALPSDIIDQVRIHKPVLVFIAALPPGGLPQAQYLCRRLRRRFPQLGIVVGYWGHKANLDKVILRLRSAGANYVTTTLLGGESHILSMLASAETARGETPRAAAEATATPQ